MKWNPQQERAINTINKNIVVSASAGAGKTTVLVARLMKRIQEDKIPVNQILAMTFTEAAASEMKKRLLKSLNTSVQTKEDPFLRQQLALIPNAQISTIHSFCLQIIKKYYYLIHLDPEATRNILDESQIALFQKTALDKTIQEAYQKNDENFILLMDLLSERVLHDTPLRDAILEISKIANNSLDTQEWFETTASYYTKYPSIKELPSPILYYFFDDLSVQTELYLEAISNLCHYASSWDDQALFDSFSTFYHKCNELRTYLTQQDYQSFINHLKSIFDFDFPRSPIKNDQHYTKLKKLATSYYDTLLQNSLNEQDFLDDIATLEKPIKELLSLTKQYLHSYQDLKSKNQSIDYNDMEHFAYQILSSNNQGIAKIYQKQFIDIYVDEFQDTNETQNSIIELISSGHNVFRVGDVKQSIYRFRGAKPSIMRSLIQEAEQNEIIYLNHNYRSKESIVEFNNQLFQQLMNLEGTSDCYNKDDNVQIGVPHQSENCQSIEFILLDRDSILDKSDTLDAKDNDLRAQFIASKIIELYQKDDSKKWSDYVVLVRNHQLKINLKKAFENTNIPHFISMPSGFYESNSVQTILSFLKLLMNPHDNISMIAVLKHLYHISNEELSHLFFTKNKNLSYYTHLSKLNHPLINTLETFTNQSLLLTELLTSVYEIKQYYSMHCNKQERTNLDLLYEKASNFQKKHGGILAFLNYISKIENEQTAEANSIGAGDDVVRVMTVHQSKGLEFPTVFFWSTSQQRIHEEKNNIVVDESLGIGINSILLPYRINRNNLFRSTILHKATKEELEEQIRLLYVALTRAKNHMIIVDTYKELDDTSLSYAGLFKKIGYSGWLRKTKAHIDSSLLNFQVIDVIQETILPKETSVQYDLPVFQNQSLETNFISPSKTELYYRKKELDISQQEGKHIGTHIHHIIENLPSDHWSEKLIREIQEDINTYWIESLMNFYHSEQYTQMKQMHIQKELPFIVKENQQIIHGYMDMVAVNDQDCILIDFKTDAIEEASDLVKIYQPQIQLYKRALEKMYPNHNITTMIYSFSLKEFIVI